MGERIQRQLDKKGMHAYALAKASGIPQSTLHYLAKGTRDWREVRVKTLISLAKVLGVTTDYLCGMHEEEG
jgi:transcriptional regulator with XRE-family HTH domain